MAKVRVEEVEVIDIDEEQEEPKSLEILGEEELATVVNELKDGYDEAKASMEARNAKLIKWRQNMEAVSADAPRNHPIKNASNVTIPVTQTLTESLFAQIEGTLSARDPLWTVESLNQTEESLKLDKVREKYLNLLLKNPYDIGMEWLTELIFETLLCGGAFPKVAYSVESWRVKDSEGGDEEVVYHDGPIITVTPLERVVYPRGISKISRLPWISIDYPMTKVELMEKVANGDYDAEAVEKILASERTTPTDTEEQAQVAEGFMSGQTAKLYDISEVYFYYDLEKDGKPVDLVFTIHFETGQVLRQQYNSLGARTIVNSRFVYRPGVLTGRGTGQKTECFQSEITALHNLRVDNAKVAGMRMIATRRNTLLGTTREIYPGAIWEMDNPKEDINAFQLGEVYPSSLAAEQTDWSLAHRAVGLSETQMGFADSTMGQRDTFRGQSMRMQRGDSILGSAISGLKSTISELGMLTWMQLVANKQNVMDKERSAKRLTDDELALLEKALDMTVADVPMRLTFLVRTTEQERTYEQRRMNVMTLAQLYNQFAQQTIPLAMQVYGPQGMQMRQASPEFWNYMSRLLVGSGKLMEDIFKFFGTQDPQNYVPDSEQLDQVLDLMQGVLKSMQNMPMLPQAAAAPGMGQQAAPMMPGAGMGAPMGGMIG